MRSAISKRLTLVLLGFVDHALDLLLRETTLVVGDGDAVRLAGGLVGGGDVEDTVGVDVEGDLDLRNTTGSRGDAGELELAEEVVVLRPRMSTLLGVRQHICFLPKANIEQLTLAITTAVEVLTPPRAHKPAKWMCLVDSMPL